MDLIDRARAARLSTKGMGAHSGGSDTDQSRAGGNLSDADTDPARSSEQAIGRSPALPWQMLGLLLAVVSLGSMGRYAVGPLGPFIMSHFSLSRAQFGVLSSAVGLGAIGTAYAAGMLVDRLGVRQMIRLGLGVIGIPLILFFFPVSFVGATILLLLSGSGFSAISPLASNGTVSWFPPSMRGLTVGLTQAGIPLGIALSGFVLPRLALAVGWDRALGLLGFTVAGMGWLLYRLYRNGPLSVAGRAAVQGAGGRGASTHGSPWAAWRDGGTGLLYALGLVLAMTQNVVISFLVPFLQDRWALPVVTAGMFLSLSQVAGMGARPLVGLVSDRFVGGRRKGLLAGMTLAGGAALALLVEIPATLPWAALVALMALVGVSTLGWPGLYLALSLEKARPGTSGAAAGVAVAAMLIGALIGPALFGYLVDTFAYRTGWLVMAAALWLTAALFLVGFREQLTR